MTDNTESIKQVAIAIGGFWGNNYLENINIIVSILGGILFFFYMLIMIYKNVNLKKNIFKKIKNFFSKKNEEYF